MGPPQMGHSFGPLHGAGVSGFIVLLPEAMT